MTCCYYFVAAFQKLQLKSRYEEWKWGKRERNLRWKRVFANFEYFDTPLLFCNSIKEITIKKWVQRVKLRGTSKKRRVEVKDFCQLWVARHTVAMLRFCQLRVAENIVLFCKSVREITIEKRKQWGKLRKMSNECKLEVKEGFCQLWVTRNTVTIWQQQSNNLP